MRFVLLRFTKLLRDILLVAVISIGPYAAVLAIILGAFYFRFVWHACTTDTKETIRNLSGLTFQVSEEDCDGFGASGSSMSVFVARTGDGDKTEVFKYEPIYFVGLPKIDFFPSEKRIAISVAWIGSIYFQRHRWGDITVDYHIGRITDADPNPPSDAHGSHAKPH